MSDDAARAPIERIVTDVATKLFTESTTSPRTRLAVIDGPSGSGKSTFAHLLKDELKLLSATVQVVNLDYLYEGWDGLSSPNFESHVESWISLPVRHGLPVNYPSYNWETHSFDAWQQLPESDCLIVEGVGALLPALATVATCRIWLYAAQNTRAQRLTMRSGPNLDDWWPQWRKQEDDYFRRHEPWKSADWLVRTDE